MAQVPHTAIDHFNMVDGLNTVSSAIRLKQSECRDVQNMRYSPIGGFSKRPGCDALNDGAVGGAAATTGLFMGRYSLAGGTNIAYLVCGAFLFKMTSALNGTWTDITGSLTITAGQNNIWNFAILNDIVVLGNGNTDASIKINSSGVASALTPGPFTKFLFAVESRGYMWYFQPTVGGNILYDTGYFSDINDPTTVGTNNFIAVAKGQGGDVRGAVDYKGYLYIFKRHGIYQVNYQPTRINSSGTLFPWNEFPNPIVPGVGTQSHRSIVKFTTPSTHATPGQELVFFVDQFGIPRIFDGVNTISFASKIGSSRDTTIKSLDDMDRSRNSYCFSINNPTDNLIYCFMSEDNSKQDVCWVLDYNVGFSWARDDYFTEFNCGALFEKSDGTFAPFVGDYGGKVYQLETGTTDDGNPINDYIVTGDDYLKSPAIRSKWYFAETRGQSGSTSQKMRISHYVDGEDTSVINMEISLANSQTTWGSFIWGQASWAKLGLVPKTTEINLVSKTIRTKIESVDKLNDTLVVEGFSLLGETLGTAQN